MGVPATPRTVLSDAQIADRLVVSRGTVGHDVSAVLRKLEARKRVETVAESSRLEVLARSQGD